MKFKQKVFIFIVILVVDMILAWGAVRMWKGRGEIFDTHEGKPVDTIVYLTQLVPVYGRKLKNTAGFERNVSAHHTVIPSGVGASCVTFKSVPTVPQPSSS